MRWGARDLCVPQTRSVPTLPHHRMGNRPCGGAGKVFTYLSYQQVGPSFPQINYVGVMDPFVGG